MKNLLLKSIKVVLSMPCHAMPCLELEANTEDKIGGTRKRTYAIGSLLEKTLLTAVLFNNINTEVFTA